MTVADTDVLIDYLNGAEPVANIVRHHNVAVRHSGRRKRGDHAPPQ